MKKYLTFSDTHMNKLTRENAVRRLIFGVLFAIPLSLLTDSLSETIVVVLTLLFFRLFFYPPRFSPLLWCAEALALGLAADLLAETAEDLFPTLIPFYWGIFLFLALSAVLFSSRFLLPTLILSGMMVLAISGAPSGWIIALFAGAVGGIYPIWRKKGEYVTFM